MNTAAHSPMFETPDSNSSLVFKYLKSLFPSITAAVFFAIGLGLVSALVGVLVGPCLQMIMAPPETVFHVNNLLGPRLGALITEFFAITEVSGGTLLEKLPLALVILAGVKAVFHLTQWFLWERAGELASVAVRSDIIKRYVLLNPSIRREDKTREMEEGLSASVTNDVRMMREYLVHFYGGLPREGLQVLFLAVTLVLLSPKLFAIFVLGILPAAIALSKIGKLLRKRAAKALKNYSDLTEWLQQRLLGIETIKHYRTEELESSKMRELTSELFHRFYKAARVKARTSPTLEAIAVTSMVVVLFIALKDVASGNTTGAVQLSFFSTLALLSQATAKIGRYLNSNREGAAAVDRIREMLTVLGRDVRENTAAGSFKITHCKPEEASFLCRDVNVRYPGQEDRALSDFSHTFSRGEIVGICGPSGAGKSTLFNLLLGLISCEKGEVELFSPKKTHHESICYMPQSVKLAPVSIAQNISYPNEEFDEKKIFEALETVNLKEFVETLSDGVNSIVGEGGAGVSGGQAQRILLARLHYHHAPFVLVDEGTSALDPEVERVVFSFLRRLADEGVGVIMIAHRISVLHQTDKILILDKGRLLASGPRDEIMSSEPFKLVSGT